MISFNNYSNQNKEDMVLLINLLLLLMGPLKKMIMGIPKMNSVIRKFRESLIHLLYLLKKRMKIILIRARKGYLNLKAFKRQSLLLQKRVGLEL